MEYCIVEDGVIVNMIVAEADFAEEIGALPAYAGHRRGVHTASPGAGAAHHGGAGGEAGSGAGERPERCGHYLRDAVRDRHH